MGIMVYPCYGECKISIMNRLFFSYMGLAKGLIWLLRFTYGMDVAVSVKCSRARPAVPSLPSYVSALLIENEHLGTIVSVFLGRAGALGFGPYGGSYEVPHPRPQKVDPLKRILYSTL